MMEVAKREGGDNQLLKKDMSSGVEATSMNANSPNSTNATPLAIGSSVSVTENYEKRVDDKNSIELLKSSARSNVKDGYVKRKKFTNIIFSLMSKLSGQNNFILAKTPMGINRFLLLIFFCIYTFICGCPYWGWGNGIQDLLNKSGAFSSYCNDPNVNYKIEFNQPTCPERDKSVGNFYTIAFACHFISSAFVGITLDKIGPKITSFIGLSFAALSWILLAFSDDAKFNAYYVSAAFMGISADACYLPLLTISNLFPQNESFIMSVLGSVRSLSFAIPLILNAAYQWPLYSANDFWRFCISYVGIGLGIATIIAIMLIPVRSFKAPVDTSQDNAECEGRNSYYDGKDLSAKDQMDAKEVKLNDDSLQAIEEVTVKRDTFLRSIMKPEFFLIVILFAFTLIRSEFYTKSNKEQLVTSSQSNFVNMYSIMTVLSFLPGPILGKLCDIVGILPVICFLNALGILMYTFLIPDVAACK